MYGDWHEGVLVEFKDADGVLFGTGDFQEERNRQETARGDQ